MVCLACLLPLFLVPIVNLLPVLFDLIMAKVYGLLGWEYRKPERAPPACPIKPSAANGSVKRTLLRSLIHQQNQLELMIVSKIKDEHHKSGSVSSGETLKMLKSTTISQYHEFFGLLKQEDTFPIL